MVIQFTPHSDEYFEKEAEKARFKEGEYPFEIVSSVEKTSKAGNPMIELEVALYKPDGSSKIIRDWIVIEGSMAWKLKRICYAINKAKIWDSGAVYADDLRGGSGVCITKLKPSKDDRDKKFLEIKEYLPRSGNDQSSFEGIGIDENIAPPALDDDIPF